MPRIRRPLLSACDAHASCNGKCDGASTSNGPSESDRVRTHDEASTSDRDTLGNTVVKNSYKKICLGCNKTRATFGTESSKPIYCSSCAGKRPNEGLRDIETKRCADCKEKKPSFGTEPGKPIYCAKCAKKRPHEGFSDVINKRCSDCKKKNHALA